MVPFMISDLWIIFALYLLAIIYIKSVYTDFVIIEKIVFILFSMQNICP